MLQQFKAFLWYTQGSLMPFRACDLCTRFYCDSNSPLHVISVQSLHKAQCQHFPGAQEAIVSRSTVLFGWKEWPRQKRRWAQRKTMPRPLLEIIAAQFVKRIGMIRTQLSRQIHRKLITIISRPDGSGPVQQHDNPCDQLTQPCTLYDQLPSQKKTNKAQTNHNERCD